LLRDAVSGVFTVDAMRERLSFAADRIEAAEKENADLKEEIAELQGEIRQLQAKLEAHAKASAKEFEEEAGALFKRNPRGGFFDVVYCPHCRTSVAWEHAFRQFICGKCSWAAPFGKDDLPGIIARLNSEG